MICFRLRIGTAGRNKTGPILITFSAVAAKSGELEGSLGRGVNGRQLSCGSSQAGSIGIKGCETAPDQ